MVTVNNIRTPQVELFNPDGESMGFVNEYQLNDVRIQIINARAPGFHVVFNNERIDISGVNGDLAKWPKGMFSLMQEQFIKLHQLRTMAGQPGKTS